MARNTPIKRKTTGGGRVAASRRKTSRTGNQRQSESKPEPIHVPLTLLKFAIGVFLLPVAWVFTLAILNVFQDGNSSTLRESPQVVFFLIGLGIWTSCFFIFPRPTKVYVFGHELTHAIFVILCGGKIGGFKVEDEGGYVLSSKTNVWISLSPYFVPLYTLFSLSLLAFINWLTPLPWLDRILFFSTGITWGFHLTFTLSMIKRGQNDLEENGTFFSLVLIYLFNLLQISALLVFASRDVTLRAYFGECLAAAGEFSRMILRMVGLE